MKNHQKPKLSVVMPFHGRHELTKKTIYSLLRHKEYQQLDLDINIIVGGKSNELKTFCIENQVQYISLSNDPLGNKFNQLFLAGAKIGDYVMIAGSDTFFSPDYFLLATEAMNNNKPSFAAERIVFFDAQTMEGRLVCTDYVGSGFAVRSDVIQEVFKKFGALYVPSANRGLDGPAFNRVKQVINANIFQLKGFQPLLIEVKTNENIWPFENFLKYPPVFWDEFRNYLILYDRGVIDSFHRNYTYYKNVKPQEIEN
jgi:hypothetical protein